MCDEESFCRLRDQTEENTKAINELAKTNVAQNEQIKTLFNTTKEQGDTQKTLVNRLVCAIVLVLVIVVFALVFGALGKDGFHAVRQATTEVAIP